MPVFVIISGGLILSRARDQPIAAFYRKRLLRVCVPLLFWSAAYTAYSRIQFGTSYTQLTHRLIMGVPYYHLWFLFALAGLYLAAPYLVRLLDALTRPQQWTAMAGGYLLFALHEAVLAVLGIAGYDAFALWLPYVPYFIFGGWLIASPVGGRRVGWAVALAGSIAVIATATGALLPLIGTSRSLNLMYGYLHPFVALSSVAIVALAQSARIGPGLTAMVARFAPFTLGIYLIHPLWLGITASYGFTPLAPGVGTPAVGIIVVSLVVFLLSYASCFVFKVIPGGRHLVT